MLLTFINHANSGSWLRINNYLTWRGPFEQMEPSCLISEETHNRRSFDFLPSYLHSKLLVLRTQCVIVLHWGRREIVCLTLLGTDIRMCVISILHFLGNFQCCAFLHYTLSWMRKKFSSCLLTMFLTCLTLVPEACLPRPTPLNCL